MTDIRVVGAGPAGLFAAEVLAKGGAKVTIIDHHAKPSRKLLLAGRGGLNLTHSEPMQKFLARYGDAASMIEPALRAFTPNDLRQWCEGLGIETFVGSSGRVFPKCMKASPVLRAWFQRLEALGVALRSGEVWQGFDDVPTILALGGASWPELGSDAEWVKHFQAKGIAVSPLVASNSRQRVDWTEDFVERFAGQPLKAVSVRCGDKTSRGELMIARDGIEGGAVYALSAALRDDPNLIIDLKPDISSEDVAAKLSRQRPKDSRSTRLRKALGLSPVAIGLMRFCGSDDPKHVVLKTSGALGLARAISTAGGVAREEVDEAFRLRKIPHYACVGEMLNWDAPTGGYLLQACFSTAYVAATSMLEIVPSPSKKGKRLNPYLSK